jgi:hypothetical protein
MLSIPSRSIKNILPGFPGILNGYGRIHMSSVTVFTPLPTFRSYVCPISYLCYESRLAYRVAFRNELFPMPNFPEAQTKKYGASQFLIMVRAS